MTDLSSPPGWVPPRTVDEVVVVAALHNPTARLLLVRLSVVVVCVVPSVPTLAKGGQVAVMAKGLAGAGATVL